jgi:hypothetical protein
MSSSKGAGAGSAPAEAARGDAACAALRAQILAGDFDGATELDLSGRGLTALPDEVCGLTQLVKLNAAGNALRDLPRGFDRLVNLRTAFFLGNAFEAVPAVLGRLPSLFMLSFKSCRLRVVHGEALAPSLGWLILTDNQLTHLPPELGTLRHLRKLMLASNRLASLPDDWSGCTSLELVRLSDNALAPPLPPSLLTLPRLAWIALAGNHLPPRHRTARLAVPPALRIPRSRLALGRLLGDGASGTVYEAAWAREGGAAAPVLPVAVKLYKPSSSDGRVEDEVAACLALAARGGGTGGQHLIATLGVSPSDDDADEEDGATSATAVQPQERPTAPALVMELLPPPSTDGGSSTGAAASVGGSGLSLLGRTPSFASVTRDVYPPGTAFTPRQAAAIATGVAHAVATMHAAGVAHGDVYAHNTLVGYGASSGAAGGEGATVTAVKLGDLGAAYFLPPSPPPQSTAALPPSPASDPGFYLRRLESRALGCLLEELLQRVTMTAADGGSGAQRHGLVAALSTLRDECLRDDVSSRPDPTEVAERLAAL